MWETQFIEKALRWMRLRIGARLSSRGCRPAWHARGRLRNAESTARALVLWSRPKRVVSCHGTSRAPELKGEAMAEDRAADHRVGVDGKVVLVTGASRGIGACCVRSLLDGGASVVVHYNTRREAAEALAQAAPRALLSGGCRSRGGGGAPTRSGSRRLPGRAGSTCWSTTRPSMRPSLRSPMMMAGPQRGAPSGSERCRSISWPPPSSPPLPSSTSARGAAAS